MPINTIFFDLDGTLYPHNNGMWAEISRKMNEYIVTTFDVPVSDVAALRESYFHEYGTTLCGLQNNFEVDTDDYLAYVHDIAVQTYINKDHALLAILDKLSPKKWVFTNSDWKHSQRVLQALGIDRQFEGIIDVWASNFVPKPNTDAYTKALEIANASDPETCVMVDDIENNIKAAKNLGFRTILVGNHSNYLYADFQIETIHQLLEVPQSLFEGS